MRNLITALILISFSASAEVYKWTDENGQTHYGDRPKNRAAAEQVEIREQKTGTLLRPQASQLSFTPSTRTPARKAASIDDGDFECDWAKERLEETEALWREFKKGGYKQSDKRSYLIQKEGYMRDIKKHC